MPDDRIESPHAEPGGEGRVQWTSEAIAEAVRLVASTTRGQALHNELLRLGWRWCGTREGIDANERRAEQSPHRGRIRWLLSELYDLELAELERLTEQQAGGAAADTVVGAVSVLSSGTQTPPGRAGDSRPMPNGVESERRGRPFTG